MELAEFALNIIIELLGGAIQASASYTSLSYFTRRKIERRVEEATAEVIEPLLPFLSREGVSEERQRLLLQICVDELRPLTQEPEALFRGSLNGQKIFDELYTVRPLPSTIVEEDLKDIYMLIGPRIATLLCSIPAAVKDWEAEAWSEEFRRFDDIAKQLTSIFLSVDELANLPSREADETLSIVRRSLAQKVSLELDLTGLRSDRPLAGKFDDFFVHPELVGVVEDLPISLKPPSIGDEEASLDFFVGGGVRAVLIGPPGAGKSTWSKWLQRQALSARWAGVAIRLELRRFSSRDLPSLHEVVRIAAGRHFAEELSADRIARWVKEKLIIFLLDGFDEIRPSERDVFHEWIVGLASAARTCPFVLTSRPLTTNHLNQLRPLWTAWNVLPFDEERVINYVGRWYRYAPLGEDSDRNVEPASLARTWLRDPAVGPLTGNPLLLSTLLMVHHLDGSLPGGRSQLYRRYVEGMLGLWDDRRQVSATAVSLTIEQKRQVVRGFALYLFLSDQEQVDEANAFSWLRGLLSEQKVPVQPELVLATLMERSGLITGPGVYGFSHKSIAEYLVAETILQGDHRDEKGRRIDRFFLYENRYTDRWNTVTFLWAGLAPIADLESFIDECVGSSDLSLACGLMFDQWDRFRSESKREMLLKVVKILGKRQFDSLLKSGMVSLYTSNPSAIGKLNLHSFDLRGLSPGIRFFELMFRAIADGTLVVTDMKGVRGVMGDLMWKGFIFNVTDLRSWSRLLRTATPKGDPSREWNFWVFEQALMGSLRRGLDLTSFVREFVETRPEAEGLVVIVLMSVSLDALDRYHETDKYRDIISVVAEMDVGKTDRKMLAATNNWVRRGFEMRRGLGEKGDLLLEFVELADRLLKRGQLPKDVYKVIEGMLDALIIMRDGEAVFQEAIVPD